MPTPIWRRWRRNLAAEDTLAYQPYPLIRMTFLEPRKLRANWLPTCALEIVLSVLKIELTDSGGRFEVVVTDSAPAEEPAPARAGSPAAPANGNGGLQDGIGLAVTFWFAQTNAMGA